MGTIDNFMKILRVNDKSPHLDTMDKFYIYKETKKGNQLNDRNLKKVFKLQKRAIRLITNISSTTSCKPYFKKLKIMTLICIYICEILLYTKMSLSKFKTNSMFHLHDTRNKSDLFITSRNTKLFEQSIG
jgi:hypothetical protein